MVKQGFHRVLQAGGRMATQGLLLGALLGSLPAQAANCGPTAPQLQRLTPKLWWVAGTGGDAQASNRGRTMNQLVLSDAGRVWLLGSGASPAAGRALACVLRQQLGWRVTDVINPWARPELVLANAAFVAQTVPARLWAHEQVAQAMQRQCPRCVARLEQSLGEAAVDLDAAQPIAVPQQLLHGDAGVLGPWRWWRLSRNAGLPGQPSGVVTLWHLAGQPWWWAPGLLWGDGPPDLRDSSAAALNQALAQLASLAEQATPGVPARWLPTQGPWLEAKAPQVQRAYLAALQAAIQARQEAGALETEPPAALPGLPAYLGLGARAGFNWQHLWREVEAQSLAPAASAVP